MRDDEATRKSYRYLRLGLVAAVVLLGASILLEYRDGGSRCWQTSISAYYYTPVRAVFVGVLMAIGLSLIVIKGSTLAEDVCLNVAGMLAPVVALVPTSDHGACWSLTPQPLPTTTNAAGETELAGWVVASIHNNIESLLYAGAISLVAASAIAVIALLVGKRRGEQRSVADAWQEPHRATFLGLVGAALLILVGALAFHFWDGFELRAHGIAAAAMIGALALAAAINARECHKFDRRRYAGLYLAIAVLMVASAPILLGTWEHEVLLVEVLEITLFAALWIVQTRELWHDTLRTRPPERTISVQSATVVRTPSDTNAGSLIGD